MELTDDIVKLATGTLLDMQMLANELSAEGIAARTVGDDLTAGLGTVLPGSVELWVRTDDANRAEEIIARYNATKPVSTESLS
ncbi:putative signal transducing protein [Limnoglobus roseus]|uniref:DUF2007 domain-containing protein n=1 Tax=Limnoglobus roseus TaxID=2598579 RepID=A0A5C1APM4_9BACT|nr:DUF2007 domain-containing protein [Limnoglobus roseus]QEL20083.1 hypothetical protein PX52LOC_07171 [Limnoglobus roseus]